MVNSIKLYTLGTSFELLSLVDPMSISYLGQLSTDTFGSGTFNIQAIKEDHFLGIDMSRPIPTDSLIEVELTDGEIIQGLISEDIVEPIIYGNNVYRHKIRFVDPLKLLTKINIPAMSITQPKTPGYLIDENLITSTKNSITDQTVFTGTHNGQLRFLNPNKPLIGGTGTNYTIYNILNSSNKFYNNMDGGVRLNNNILETIGLEDVVYVSGENKTSLRLNFSIFNPQYNKSFASQSKNSFNNVEESTNVTFSEGSVKFMVEVYVGTTLIRRYGAANDVLEVPASKVANGSWAERKVQLITEEVSWKINPPAVDLPSGDNHYLWLDARFPGVKASNNGNMVLVNTDYEYTNWGPQNPQNKYSVVLHDYKTTFSRTIPIPTGVSGNVSVKFKVVDNTPWKLSGQLKHKYINWGIQTATTTYTSRSMDKVLLLKDLKVELYETAKDGKYLDDQINKAINLVEGHNIKLSENAMSKLSLYKAPELTYDKNNLYEIVRDMGLYVGAIPKVKVFKEQQITKWVEATESEYETSQNKLYLDMGTDSMLDILNRDYKNYPLGYAIKVAPFYKIVETSYIEYNYAPVKLDIAMSIGGYIVEGDIWYGLKHYHPFYYNNLKRLYEEEAIIKVEDIGLGVKYFKLVLNDDAEYAKTENAGISTPIDLKEIDFTFSEDIEYDRVMVPENTKTQALYRDSDNYISSIEMNVDNLVSEDSIVETGWLKLTTLGSDEVKMTTDNITVKLPNGPIYKIISAEMKLSSNSYNNTFEMDDGSPGTTISGSTVYDISDLIYEETAFKTLINKSTYTVDERIGETTMNQALYYKQGDPYIYNMAFTGNHEPASKWESGTESNRTIWEIAAKKAVQEFGVNTNPVRIDPGKVQNDTEIRLNFKYIPYTSTRTNIYKDDQSGFPEDTTRFYNEQQRINNPTTLGRKAQSEINRMGNTHEEIDGISSQLNKVPKLGTLNRENGRSLVSLNRVLKPGLVEYTGTYIKDYSTINEYFGIESGYRQWEVPKEDIVERIDKRETKFYISSTYEGSDTGVNYFENKLDVFRGLGGLYYSHDTAPNFVLIDTYKANGEHIAKTIRPVNTQSIGKGLSHTYVMEDNYSAGKQTDKEVISGQTQYYQKDTEYADFYGHVETIKLTFVRISLGDTDTMYLQNPKFPEITGDIGYMEVVSTYNYRIQKDSRETIGFAQDIKFFSSNQDNIKIYEGLAKYNSMSAFPHEAYNIKVGILNRPLHKSAVKIDSQYLIENDDNIMGLTADDQINFTVYGTGVEVVYYEENTLEPLLVYAPENGIEDSLTGTLYIQIRGNYQYDFPVYEVVFKRYWNDTIIKTVYINQGKSATLPTEAEIAYGAGYLPDGYIGNIENITSDRTIYIKRKSAPTMYTVTFKRGWDGTTIKSQSVQEGYNATFPTASQINYGEGYEYDYHTGVYTNVISNRIITIYRKAKTMGIWVKHTEIVSVLPPPSSGNSPTEGAVCYPINARWNSRFGLVNPETGEALHTYYVCEQPIE